MIDDKLKPSIGSVFTWHDDIQKWKIVQVDGDYPYFVQAKNVKKDGSLGKLILSYWTDKTSRSKISRG